MHGLTYSQLHPPHSFLPNPITGPQEGPHPRRSQEGSARVRQGPRPPLRPPLLPRQGLRERGVQEAHPRPLRRGRGLRHHGRRRQGPRRLVRPRQARRGGQRQEGRPHFLRRHHRLRRGDPCPHRPPGLPPEAGRRGVNLFRCNIKARYACGCGDEWTSFVSRLAT